MKVGVIGSHEQEDSFAINIVSTLIQMGHDALPYGGVIPLSEPKLVRGLMDIAAKQTEIERRLQLRLLRKAEEHAPELIISVDGSLFPDIVRLLKRKGRTKVVLWFPDAVKNLKRMLMFLEGWDALFFKEPFLVDRATAFTTTPTHYLAEACNPAWHSPPNLPIRDHEVVVVGNMHPWRIALLERLLLADIPIRIYGGGFPRWCRSSKLEPLHAGRYVTRHRKAEVFRSAGVVLNHLHPAEIYGVNCRLFEAAGCGAAILSEERRELSRVFDVDSELFTFGAFGELVEQIHWMLSHPQEVRARGDRAALRAHREHTYQHRLTRMFECLA